MRSQLKLPNDEIIARLAYVADRGNGDQKSGANARISLLRDTLKIDREFPSSVPLLPAVETEIWNWWHITMSKPQNSNVPV